MKKLQIPSVFSNNMIFQQQQKNPVWGTASAGAEVTVSINGNTYHSSADESGAWSLTIDELPLVTAEPYTLTIESEGETVTFTNILSGEVWLCSGQSNMEWSLEQCEYFEEMENADNRDIRLYKAPQNFSAEPLFTIENAQWQTPSPLTTQGFSSVAYFFAQKLNRELNIPIGVMDISHGASYIEAWFPNGTFGEKPNEHPLVTQNIPMPETGSNSCSSYYNALLHHAIPFGIKGFLWYQGESNLGDIDTYVEKQKLLMQCWRELWNNDELPFYFAEIAPFQYTNTQTIPARSLDRWTLSEFREQQMKIAKSTQNSAIISTIDVGTLNDVHPKNKKTVAQRFADVALNYSYAKERVCSGPTFDKMECEEEKLRIYFDNCGSGLFCKHVDGGRLNMVVSVEIAGDDNIFVPAQTKLEGNTLLAWSFRLNCPPTQIRYAWDDSATTNLFNTEGYPAFIFRAKI
jgi:sialate O-acetylesterase